MRFAVRFARTVRLVGIFVLNRVTPVPNPTVVPAMTIGSRNKNKIAV